MATPWTAAGFNVTAVVTMHLELASSLALLVTMIFALIAVGTGDVTVKAPHDFDIFLKE